MRKGLGRGEGRVVICYEVFVKKREKGRERTRMLAIRKLRLPSCGDNPCDQCYSGRVQQGEKTVSLRQKGREVARCSRQKLPTNQRRKETFSPCKPSNPHRLPFLTATAFPFCLTLTTTSINLHNDDVR